MLRSRSILFAALLGALLFSSIAVCQDARAHVQGTVADPSGAAISGAAVTLINVNTGVITRAMTNDTGRYRWITPIPARTSLTSRAPGSLKLSNRTLTSGAG